jgi:hypothetical protein
MSDGGADLRPARGYSWPPFEESNGAAVTHGAYSLARVKPRARELVSQILMAHPHLDDVRDGPAVFRYCATLARTERIYEWLDDQEDSVFSDVEAGTTHGCFGRLERWERQADAAEERLGISPLAKVKMGLQQARGAALVEYLRQAYGESRGGVQS